MHPIYVTIFKKRDCISQISRDLHSVKKIKVVSSIFNHKCLVLQFSDKSIGIQNVGRVSWCFTHLILGPIWNYN